MTYDFNNIFAKILRGEISCNKVYEDNKVLAFHDINPQAPAHVLVIPKKDYINFHDFVENAPADLIQHFFKTVAKISQDLNLIETGYRIISNCGNNGGQEVPHFHVHLCGGKKLGKIC